jgi:streptogrisin C
VTSSRASERQRDAEPSPRTASAYAEEHGVSVETAQRQLRAQLQGYDLGEALRDRLGNRFAGAWFDNERGRYVVAAVPGTRPAVVEVLAERGIASTSEVREVDHTYADLEAQRDKTAEALGDLLRRAEIQVGLDEQDNAASLVASQALEAQDRERIAEHAAAAAVSVSVRYEPDSFFEIPLAACAYPNCSQPMRGGVAIGFNNAYWCTAGFYAWKGSRRFILTAGHCLDDQLGQWQAWNPYVNPWIFNMGNQAGFYYNQFGDAGRIDVTGTHWDPSAWPPMTAAWTANEEHVTWSRAYSIPGQFFCRFGRTTQISCGTVEAVGTWVTFADNTTHGNITRATGCANGGDSGGPVMIDHTAVGLVNAANPCGTPEGRLYWTEIMDAQYALDVTVAATG